MKKTFPHIAPLTALLLIISSCASLKQHRPEGLVVSSVSENPVDHKVFLIGDAGEETDEQRRVLALTRELILQSEVPATVVYLGDNIYPVGLPSKKDSAARLVAEGALLRQVEAVADIAKQVIFIPGNHDWSKGHEDGKRAINRQEKFLKKLGLDNVRLLPEDNCPGPEEIDITPECGLLLMDSQWWLQDWSIDKDINDDCDVKTRFDFVNELAEVIKDNKERQLIVALHHPLISGGSHNGYFSTRDHLFPLTLLNPKLFIPLPVLGSIYPVYRSTYGNVQDIPHPKYAELVEAVFFAAQNHNEVIFASGHQHSLEVHKKNGHHLLVSGSGSRIDPIAKSPTMRYGHAEAGLMQLDLRQGGGIDLKVWEPDADGKAKAPEYEANLIESRTFVEPLATDTIINVPDSATTIISSEYVRGNFHQFLFGERYRELYNLPVNVRALDLSTEHGGLEVVKKGGGFQTNSLRLEAGDERQYVLRSLNKDATRLLPEIFQSTFANELLQDQFTASHPYSAFVIPGMAEAAGIYHTNPEVVYLPDQQGLGRYAADFADQLYLYEERPSGDWTGYSSFGGSQDIVNFKEVIEETIEDHDNRVDQEFVLRSRLFDMIIADWDRHDDQWRWAEFKDDQGKLYRPIPRDRDQAFSNYEGILHRLAQSSPNLRKMTKLTGDIKNIKWFNLNAQWFDRDFLNALTREQWISMARELQKRLTDTVIDQSLSAWPDQVFEVHGESISAILKERRDNLEEFAEDYYEELAKRVFIRGTEDEDFFLVTRNKKSTFVQVFDSNKDGDRKDLYYEREFYDGETQQIELYGLDGRDRFQVVGEGGSNIKVHMLGGEGKDRFNGEKGSASRVRGYDTHSERRGEGVRYREVSERLNIYDRKSFKYNYAIPGTRVGFNPDDGILIGAGMTIERHAFKKFPFASRHRFGAFYAFGSGAYGASYIGEWKNVFGPFGIDLDAVYEAPSYVENYFGFGNDTEETDDDIEFYRVRKRSFRVLPALTLGNGDTGNNLKVHVGLQSHFVDSTENRFIADLETNGLPEDVFDDRRFLTARLEYFFRSIDDPVLTTRGFDFRFTAGLDYEPTKDDLHRFIKTSLTLYYQFQTLGRTVLATRIGAEWHGGEYQFYQGARLGAHENFRGMHRHRLLGERLFYQNIDLRINLAQWRSYYLPAKFGVMLSFDHGRVWQPEEVSNTWHYAYGGGLWLSPFQTLLLSVGYHVSDLDQRFEFHMGFFF